MSQASGISTRRVQASELDLSGSHGDIQTGASPETITPDVIVSVASLETGVVKNQENVADIAAGSKPLFWATSLQAPTAKRPQPIPVLPGQEFLSPKHLKAFQSLVCIGRFYEAGEYLQEHAQAPEENQTIWHTVKSLRLLCYLRLSDKTPLNYVANEEELQSRTTLNEMSDGDYLSWKGDSAWEALSLLNPFCNALLLLRTLLQNAGAGAEYRLHNVDSYEDYLNHLTAASDILKDIPEYQGFARLLLNVRDMVQFRFRPVRSYKEVIAQGKKLVGAKVAAKLDKAARLIGKREAFALLKNLGRVVASIGDSSTPPEQKHTAMYQKLLLNEENQKFLAEHLCDAGVDRELGLDGASSEELVKGYCSRLVKEPSFLNKERARLRRKQGESSIDWLKASIRLKRISLSLAGAFRSLRKGLLKSADAYRWEGFHPKNIPVSTLYAVDKKDEKYLHLGFETDLREIVLFFGSHCFGQEGVDFKYRASLGEHMHRPVRPVIYPGDYCDSSIIFHEFAHSKNAFDRVQRLQNLDFLKSLTKFRDDGIDWKVRNDGGKEMFFLKPKKESESNEYKYRVYTFASRPPYGALKLNEETIRETEIFTVLSESLRSSGALRALGLHSPDHLYFLLGCLRPMLDTSLI